MTTVTWTWGPDSEGDAEEYRLTLISPAEYKLECKSNDGPWREIRDGLLLAKRVIELTPRYGA